MSKGSPPALVDRLRDDRQVACKAHLQRIRQLTENRLSIHKLVRITANLAVEQRRHDQRSGPLALDDRQIIQLRDESMVFHSLHEDTHSRCVDHEAVLAEEVHHEPRHWSGLWNSDDRGRVERP